MLTTPTLLNKVDLRKYNNSLSTAIADSDLVGKTLVVTEAVTCGTVTIPDTIALEILNGGSISVNAGATLSVNGSYDSCVETPFLGSGSVVINSPVKNNNHDNLTGTSVHGLGTASTANVTTSATDRTAGRLLKVGDFGIGSQHDLRGTIFVTGTPSSVYGIGSVTGMCSGGPDGLNITPWIPSANSYGVLEVSSHWGDSSALYATIRRFTQLGNVYIQYVIDSNTWGPWRKCYGNQDVLGTVSNYSGLPSGAIVQKVSVAQGTATLFADGLVVCNSFTDDVAVDTAVGNIYKASTPINHVLPYAVDAAYGLVTAHCSAITLNTRWHNAIYWGPGLVRIDSYASEILTVSEGINVIAIGRWY